MNLKLIIIVFFSSESPLTERHSVLAEVRAIIGSEGGSLVSSETGVSMFIPAGAIEKGNAKEIFFKVCRDNNMCPPLDAEKGLLKIDKWSLLDFNYFSNFFCYRRNFAVPTGYVWSCGAEVSKACHYAATPQRFFTQP